MVSRAIALYILLINLFPVTTDDKRHRHFSLFLNSLGFRTVGPVLAKLKRNALRKPSERKSNRNIANVLTTS